MHVSLTTTYNRRFPNMHMIYTVTFMFEKKKQKIYYDLCEIIKIQIFSPL